MWDEFDRSDDFGDVYWEVKAQGLADERLVIQWDNFNFYYDFGYGSTETVTFQAVLYAADGEIQFRYADLDVTDEDFTEGNDATVGIGIDQFVFPNMIPESTFIDGVHTISDTFTGVQDDLVRLSWETDGAAWNNDIISGGSGTFQAQFDTAFIQSIGDQIARKHATGDVVFPDDPLLEINLGDPAFVGTNFITDTDPILGPNFLPAGTTMAGTTNPILQNGNSMSGDAETLSVFQTARVMDSANMDISLPANLVPDGSYIVELMLANIDGVDQFMDVVFENDVNPMLSGDIIQNDFSQIPAGSSGAPEYEAIPSALGTDVPIVKRFSVDVADGNGLQISLNSHSNRDTVLNGLRILKSPPPRIFDVRIDGRVTGAEWVPEAKISYAQRVAMSEQLRPIFTENANTIEIQFDGPVNFSDGSELTLARTVNALGGGATNDTLDADDFMFTYDPVNYAGKWTFDDPLVNGKYAIHLSTAVTGNGGQALDGEWVNPASLTTVNSLVSTFPSGDGTAGGHFNFVATLLPGDANLDGYVDGADVGILFSNWGMASGALFADADYNGDGMVDMDDWNLTIGNWGGRPAGDMDFGRFEWRHDGR